MTNGAVLSLLKLTKVIIYVDKEIFLCILFFLHFVLQGCFTPNPAGALYVSTI